MSSRGRRSPVGLSHLRPERQPRDGAPLPRDRASAISGHPQCMIDGMRTALRTRRTAAALGALLLGVVVSGCASSDAQAQVDDFCANVEQLVRKANKYAKNPADTKLGNEITQTGQQLLEQAPGLAATVASNPGLAPRLQECTSQLQNIGQGSQGKEQ